MPPLRRLWTGPYAANLRGWAVDHDDGQTLWIVPSQLARDQVRRDLIAHHGKLNQTRVWSWDDLWIQIVRAHSKPPRCLSDAGARSAILEAIDEARSSRKLGPLATVADRPGFRKQLRQKIAAWTITDRKPEGPPPQTDAITKAEWYIYRAYRDILNDHKSEDAAGLIHWASRHITKDALGKPRSITILDPIAPSAAQLKFFDWACKGTYNLLVTLPTSGDIFGDDPAIDTLRTNLLELGFEQEILAPGTKVEHEHANDNPPMFGAFESFAKPTSSPSLAQIETSLFQVDNTFSDLGPIDNLTIQKGPRGEAQGLLLAREVSRCLAAGITPDDILVLVRNIDDDAARSLEILKAWGIPASGKISRPLASEPAVAALLAALSLPEHDWEKSRLVRFLRHAQLNFASLEARTKAATEIQSLPVFRGNSRIDLELSNLVDQASRDLFHQLTQFLNFSDEPATWTEHFQRLRNLTQALAIGNTPRDEATLEAVWQAIDDHSLISSMPDQLMTVQAFHQIFRALLIDLEAPSASLKAGTVRLLRVDEAAGSRARVIILANLGEGTFPTRAAVKPTPFDDGMGLESARYAKERLQFLHAFGAASDETILLVPTSNEKGDELLPAGFVDDLSRKLGPIECHPRFQTLQRLDPTFREHPDLAQSAADARVLAIAQACLDRDTSSLARLAQDPRQKAALAGVAEALWLTHERLRIKRYTQFDGWLQDPQLLDLINQRLGPSHTFSPSQFESFATCPFQFYQRYVLNLSQIDASREFAVDRTERGIKLHDALENIHGELARVGSIDILGDLEIKIQTKVSAELTVSNPKGDVSDGLEAIENEILNRTLERYIHQYQEYAENPDETVRPHLFEVSFGSSKANHPDVVLGHDSATVRLRGVIDRVDLVESQGKIGFRVIDYKSGKAPANADVTKKLQAIQLPLYALAVEQILEGDPTSPCDFGYWGLKETGFKKVKLDKETWPEFRERVIEKVLELASQLRSGQFQVAPTKHDCTRFCEFKTVCRIGQVRSVDKAVFTTIPTH
jgi:hypothetical protein